MKTFTYEEVLAFCHEAFQEGWSDGLSDATYISRSNSGGSFDKSEIKKDLEKIKADYETNKEKDNQIRQ